MPGHRGRAISLIVVMIVLATVGACARGVRSPARPLSAAEVTHQQITSAPHRRIVVPTAQPGTVPRFRHIVVVIEENHSYSDVALSPKAPYLTSLSEAGVRMTNSFAITHPSQPNYLALFSGSTLGTTDDSCPQHLSGPNLASELQASGGSFVGYSESLPAQGFTGCASGSYARKHAPWTNFDLPRTMNQPFAAFPHDYNRLPSVAFVIPNLDHDMHNGTIGQADHWLSDNLGAFARWAPSHDSLLIVTFDEGADRSTNHILTVLSGANLMPGTDGARINHYSLLRTIEDAFQLPPLRATASAKAITADWQP